MTEPSIKSKVIRVDSAWEIGTWLIVLECLHSYKTRRDPHPELGWYVKCWQCTRQWMEQGDGP